MYDDVHREAVRDYDSRMREWKQEYPLPAPGNPAAPASSDSPGRTICLMCRAGEHELCAHGTRAAFTKGPAATMTCDCWLDGHLDTGVKGGE